MTKRDKEKQPAHWLMKNRKGQISAATAAIFKAESEGRTVAGEGSLVHETGTSRGPGGRALKTTDRTDDLFGDDDDEADGARRKREKDMGREGDLDELDFEETFQDDEEKMDVDEKEDDEAKEIEVRLAAAASVLVFNESVCAGTAQARNEGGEQTPRGGRGRGRGG
jgi:transcription initiation factor TFIIF subunit alpha